MNLPNSLSAARIAAAPFLIVLPFIPSWQMRLLAFALFVIAGMTDYWDGRLARERKLVTDLGRLLDPLADKMFIVATLVPVFLLMGPRAHWLARLLGVQPDPNSYPFVTPFGEFDLPWWILTIVLAREVAMTIFRTAAARRGVVIAAMTSAKWKTTFQAIWIGAAYFWFFAATLAANSGWNARREWIVAENAIGVIGVVSMITAVTLTLSSVALYAVRYGGVFTRQTVTR